MIYSLKASQRSFEILSGDGLRHLRSMNAALEKIWSKRPTDTDHFVLINNADIQEAIISFVTDFGHVSTMLFDNSPKRTSENGAVYRIRTERVARVAQFFEGIDTRVFSDRNIRNRHFHADEHVSRALLRHPDAVIIQDLALNKRALFQSELPIIYLRVYEYDRDLLLHLDAEFDVKKLYETGLLIAEKLKLVDP